MQIGLRRILVRKQLKRYGDIWPIDHRSAGYPEWWTGWPEGKAFALVLTHDVDTARGQDRCRELIEMEKEMGFRSSFNFVPERYSVETGLRRELTEQGFEVGVHGLCHDGKYFDSKKIFRERAKKINYYINEWGAVGFRFPSMLHNLAWIHDLNIEYDASTFDTDPFEPQSDGMATIFPFFVDGQPNRKGYVEMPYTLPQDFTLFCLMREKNIDIWKKKLDWIAEKSGMALINVHPDYMNFGNARCGLEEYPATYYWELLNYIKGRYAGTYWHDLPREVARFWNACKVKSDTPYTALAG